MKSKNVRIVCKAPEHPGGHHYLPISRDVKMLDSDGNDLLEKMLATGMKITISIKPGEVVTALVEIAGVELDIEAEAQLPDPV